MKENQRIAVTKRMLKEGLLRLLRDKDLKNIRITELCAESGVNRATFYRHYETVEDVLCELERDIARKMLPSSGVPTDLSRVRFRLEEVFSFAAEHSEIMKILFRCNAEEDMIRRINEFYNHYLQLHSVSNIGIGVDAATGKSVAAFFAGGFYCLLRQWVDSGMEQSPAHIAEIAAQLIRWPIVGR